MPALTAGKVAPDFTSPTLDGGSFSLRDALKRGPVVLAFFKISCPICQFAFPYVERLHEAYKGKSVTVIGVSQNDRKDTAQFVKEYGITFPVALDDPKKYPASNAYGLTNVPTIFYVSPDGDVEQSSVGWSRSDMEELTRRLAEAAQASPAAIFKPGEDVPEFRAG
jgi:peroxiredoxin